MPSGPPSAPVTLFFVHSGDDLYGSDMVLLDIVRGLDPLQFRPWVLLPADSAHTGKLSAVLREEGIPYQHLSFPVVRRRYFTPFGVLRFLRESSRGLREMRSLARRENARLVCTNTLAVPIGAVFARQMRLPHLWHVHEILVKPRVVRRFLHWMVARFSDLAVCISEAVKLHVLADQPSARLQVVYNGIRTPEFSAELASNLRDSLGVPQNGLLIGTIGRISTWKGQVILARAAALVRDAGEKVTFLVMGGVFDGDERPRQDLAAVVNEHHLQGSFHIRDFDPKARAMLPAFDIFVLPSISPEPFGLVVTEAMAAGCAVVATDHGGPREIVVDGQSGLLVPPEDSRALADALLRLIRDPALRQQLAKAGQQRVADKFSLSRFLAEMSGCYHQVLSETSNEGTVSEPLNSLL